MEALLSCTRFFAQAIDLVINSKKNITTNQIYNVGSDKNNHTKKDIMIL